MKVAPVSNICYLVFPAHLCLVRPRVHDSCSLIYRAIHIREVYGTPLSQSLIPSYFLGPQTSLRFYYDPVLMPCLPLYLRLCEEHTVLFWKRNVYAVSTSPATLSGSQSLTAIVADLEAVSELAYSVAGST